MSRDFRTAHWGILACKPAVERGKLPVGRVGKRESSIMCQEGDTYGYDHDGIDDRFSEEGEGAYAA